MTWSYDVTIPNGMVMKRHLLLTPEAVTFQNKTILLASINEVRVSMVRNYTNGIPTMTTYKVKLASPVGHMTCQWGYSPMQKKETKQLCEASFRQLMDLLDRTVGARIAEYIATHATEFGDYQFQLEGVSYKGLLGTKTIPWHRICGGHIYQGQMSVRYLDDTNSEKFLGSMSLWQPNAYFLPEIVQAVRDRYLGGGVPTSKHPPYRQQPAPALGQANYGPQMAQPYIPQGQAVPPSSLPLQNQPLPPPPHGAPSEQPTYPSHVSQSQPVPHSDIPPMQQPPAPSS